MCSFFSDIFQEIADGRKKGGIGSLFMDILHEIVDADR